MNFSQKSSQDKKIVADAQLFIRASAAIRLIVEDIKL